MQPKIKARTPVSWGFPVFLWSGSLAILAAGWIVDTALFDFAFVMLVTSAIVTVMAVGSAMATMDVTLVGLVEPLVAPNPDLSSAFFPRGAIAFFVSMLAFFGGIWMALYGLMIYRSGNI
jgi:hypothetical protein